MLKFGRAGSTFATVVIAAIVIAIVGASGAVAGGLITSKKIKNNTIKSIDVKNNNLTGTDIADGSLGTSDLAGAARGFTNIVTKRETAPVASGATSKANVSCGAGQVAIGGGGYVVPVPVVIGGTEGFLQLSVPTSPGPGPLFLNGPAGDNTAPQAWRTWVINTVGADTTAVHYAICASK